MPYVQTNFTASMEQHLQRCARYHGVAPNVLCVLDPGGNVVVYGKGPTWEHAFARAKGRYGVKVDENSVTITGEYKEVPKGFDVRAELEKRFGAALPTSIVTGGSGAVDRVAEQWAKTRGVPILRVPPDWEAHGKAAPFQRISKLLWCVGRVLVFASGPLTPALAQLVKRAELRMRDVTVEVIDMTEAK